MEDNNSLNFNDDNSSANINISNTPVGNDPKEEAAVINQMNEEINAVNSNQVNTADPSQINYEYSNVLAPGEELDDFHYQEVEEVIDTSFLKTNILSIISLFFALFIPFVPILMAIIGMKQIKKTHAGGKVFAIIAIVLNVLVTIGEIILLLYILRVGPFENKMKDVTREQMDICSTIAYGCDLDEDGDGFKTCSYCSDDLCIDIHTIDCPTDKLLKDTEKDEKDREKLNLNN